MLLNTWKAFLLSAPEVFKGNINIYYFISAKEAPTLLGTMAGEMFQHKWTPLLAVAPVTKKMKIYLHISSLGVTCTRPSDKVVRLEGLGPVESPVPFPIGGFTLMVDFKFPTAADIAGATNAANFTALPSSGNSKWKEAPYILLPHV